MAFGSRRKKLLSNTSGQVMLCSTVEDYLVAGQVIAGRYRLEQRIGLGGQGTVWEARQLALETQIAIKFLNIELSRRHDLLARFSHEATSAARIRSPHVVSIFDSGFTEDGRAFIAMELLRGEDLGRRLTRFGKLTINETALLVAQVSRGLSKAHSVDVVHRDLKPENIFIVDEDDGFLVKILDFGIAKSVDSRVATHKTDTGQLLASPPYMSPEQALGRKVDARSDLYSLAVVAYRCLAGRPPFTHSAVGELIVAVSTHLPPPPSQFNRELSPEIDDWFAGALAKEPDARAAQTPLDLAESFFRACGDAVAGLPTPSDSLRGFARQSSPPSPRPGGLEPPSPSQEEIATTVVDTQPPPSPAPRPQRAFLARNWRTLVAASLVTVFGTAVFRVSTRHVMSTSPKVLAQLDPERPAQEEAPPAIGPSSSVATRERHKDVLDERGKQKSTLPVPKAPEPLSKVIQEAAPVASTDPSAATISKPSPPRPLTIDRTRPWP